MKALLVLVLVIVMIGAGVKMSGGRLPLIDYPLGPIGVDSPGPAMPGVEIEAPGFGDWEAP
ncbi:MAG: hypothetical protein ACR2H0_08575 [Candidatus Limnocylindrales bacterium]